MNMTRLRTQCAGAVVLAAAVCSMAACASAPVPNEKLAVARDSVQRAERSGAPELAPVQLSTAKDKLNKAEAAATHHDNLPATQLADQANIDAQLAEATATAQKSHKAAIEFDASMQALRQESLRSTPVPAPAQSSPPST